MQEQQNKILVLIIAVTCLLFVLTLFMALTIIIYNKRKRKMLLEKQLLEKTYQQELLRTQLEIQEQTLKTISEEIHDNVGQVLSLAKLNLNTINNIGDPKIQHTKSLIGKAINDLRNLSRSMHADVIAELGLKQSLANELAIIENTRQFETDMQVSGSPVKLERQQEMVLFRIAQEALNNCIKYSKAKMIRIGLEYGTDFFVMSVADNGIGFDKEKGSGIGLKSMQNRARLIGAEFSVNSTINGGAQITVKLPLSQ